MKKNLRLTIDGKDLNRVRNLRYLREMSSQRAITGNAGSIFFDTADHQLAARKVTIEVRKVDQRYVQTVCAGGITLNGMRVRRLFWENPLPTPEPDPGAVGDADLRALATPNPGSVLEPVLQSKIHRTTRHLVTPRRRAVTFALENGEFESGKAKRPFYEILLDTKSADGGAPFDVALGLHAKIPVRVATTSRENAALQAMGGEPAWRKAIALDLPKTANVEDTLVHILHHCLDHLMDNEQVTRLSDHPEGVHQMRVAMRRMRSALRIFRDVMPREQYDRITDEVKWQTKSLADTRDLDVFMDEIVGPVAAALDGDPAFDVLNARLAKDRAKARTEARKEIADPRFTQFLLETLGWIEGHKWRRRDAQSKALLQQPIIGLSDNLLSKRFKTVRKKGRVFDTLSVEEKHQLRIDVKKLRYATDFFSSLYGRERVRDFTIRLGKLQDGLGYMNDVAVARELVAHLVKTSPRGTAGAIGHAGALVLGWHSHGAELATRSLAEDVAGLLACKRFWSTTGKAEK
ncbi:MAG: CHAD domain-containing protein [Alphaproteobacteria bacterium]|nr:CHAD domain-containing protein [Alphaproteobacteria bacterium]